MKHYFALIPGWQIFWVMILLFVSNNPLRAQQDSTINLAQDSLGGILRTPPEQIEVIQKKSRRTPQEAALKAAVFPGWGQAYNKKYWKIPIVYAGAITFGYSIYWNQTQYVFFRDSYQNFLLANPASGGVGGSGGTSAFGTPDRLRTLRNEFRRQKEQLIIYGIGWYILSIVDAVVDTHFADYNMDDDISLRIRPLVQPVQTGTQPTFTAGVTLSFQLK